MKIRQMENTDLNLLHRRKTAWCQTMPVCIYLSVYTNKMINAALFSVLPGLIFFKDKFEYARVVKRLFTKYMASFGIESKYRFYHHMVLLNLYLTCLWSIVINKYKWFQTILEYHGIHRWMRFQTVFILCGVCSEQVNIASEWDIIYYLLARHQRNTTHLIRSLYGYLNNAKTKWHLYL